MNNLIKDLEHKTDNELLKMVYEFDQWNEEVLIAVQNELSGRGKLPTDIQARREKLIADEDRELTKGEVTSFAGQALGWITSFGLLGIYIGYSYKFAKVKSKYTGKFYFKYDEQSRKNGHYLLVASIILSFAGIVFRIMKYEDHNQY